MQFNEAEIMAQIPSISLTKIKEKSVLIVTFLQNYNSITQYFRVYFKPDKKARLSTPSAYWAKRGFCKLPKGSWFFPTTH